MASGETAPSSCLQGSFSKRVSPPWKRLFTPRCPCGCARMAVLTQLCSHHCSLKRSLLATLGLLCRCSPSLLHASRCKPPGKGDLCLRAIRQRLWPRTVQGNGGTELLSHAAKIVEVQQAPSYGISLRAYPGHWWGV